MRDSSIGPGSERRLLRDGAYQVLRQWILEQRLHWGQELLETDLAAELGISRTPIREGIRQLESDGLIIRTHAGRLRVREFSERDIAEIYEVLIPLYGLSAELAAAHYSPEVDARFETILATADVLRDPMELQRLNDEFHRLIAEISGNQWLTRTLLSLREYSTAFRRSLASDEGRWRASQEDHKQIRELLRAGRGVEASNLMEEHIRHARDRLLALRP